MAVSFSSGAKAEVCRTLPQKHCCALAECFGILLFCNSFGADGIRIITESVEFSQILPRLFKKAFSVSFDQLPDENSRGKLVFQITDSEKLRNIMNAYGFDSKDTISLHVNMPIVEEECCKAAFLRGAFLAGGSVTDPTKGYHIELTTTHNSVSAETYMLMEDVLGFYPKTALRGGAQVLYIKQSDMISDFLTFLSAPVAGMGIIEAKLEKELTNKVNRRCNCDDAKFFPYGFHVEFFELLGELHSIYEFVMCMEEHDPVEIRRGRLEHESAVEVEHGYAVFLRDEVRRPRPGHGLHIFDKRGLCRRAVVPKSPDAPQTFGFNYTFVRGKIPVLPSFSRLFFAKICVPFPFYAARERKKERDAR